MGFVKALSRFIASLFGAQAVDTSHLDAEIAKLRASAEQRNQELEEIKSKGATLQHELEQAKAQARADVGRLEQQLTQIREEHQRAQAALDATHQEREEREAEKQARRDECLRRMKVIGMLESEYNIGFVGITGCGKSTLVNTLRNQPANRHTAAPTSSGWECTQDACKYMLGSSPIALWDLPGGSTANHPTDTYCYTHCLDLFNGLVLVCNGRFPDVCSSIVQYAITHDRPLIILCTKTDDAVRSALRSGQFADELDAIRHHRNHVTRHMLRELRQLGHPAPESVPVLMIDSLSFLAQSGSPALWRFDEALFVVELYKATSRTHQDGGVVYEVWDQIVAANPTFGEYWPQTE